jgi:hypothetical protein
MKDPIPEARNFSDTMQRLRAEQAAALQRLLAWVESLPDNPRIQRSDGRAFVLRKKDLGDNWSPEHHDFRKSYRLICDHLRRAEDPARAFEEVVASGKFRIPSGRGDTWTLNLHPDVIGHLKTGL